MAGDAYGVYKELVREEQFAPQGNDSSVTTDNRIATRREHAIGRSLRRGIILIVVCWIVYFFYLNRLFVQTPADDSTPGKKHTSGNGSENRDAKKVPFEAHIMSKCPDARDCLQQLVVPAMEQISDKVDFRLSFIGNVSNKTSEVECKHGPTECVGNMILLCAANLPFPPGQKSSSSSPASKAPRTPVIRSLGFANCMVSSYEKIPDRRLVEDCALEHGIDFNALNQCASRQDDDEDDPGNLADDAPSGIALLRQSARHSENLGVKTSCTVRLDEQVWCVRDGGTWKDCAKGGSASKVRTLIEEVEKLYKQRNQVVL